MGSLTSGPSAPTPQSQIVYVPQPVNTTTIPTDTTTSSQVSEVSEDTAGDVRTQNLLGRERSRFGTVQTSFRGLLGLASQDNTQSRKTLLGE